MTNKKDILKSLDDLIISDLFVNFKIKITNSEKFLSALGIDEKQLSNDRKILSDQISALIFHTSLYEIIESITKTHSQEINNRLERKAGIKVIIID
ncbi:hypothetical protein [Lentilactobacillus hilgardii]|uniref:hypothetical protein n=1 Tax=Lentilactobacillus hilgardii TaxID=1588 RepID=UPI0021A8D4C0|nr:hypothetical protein [Lentilactobacillus hilgardii]MCT3397782.1 hypothetical protein [Lentilactobacillus hilgardii]